MVAAGVIPHRVVTNPSFSAIINGFLSSLPFSESVEEIGSLEKIEDWCNRFLNALHNVGRPFVEAANNFKMHLKSSIMKKFSIQFNI